MEYVIWTGTICEGQEALYELRHRQIWPEMVENLKAQGIRNYSIFRSGRKVIGYYECPDLDRMRTVKAGNPAAARWAASMDGIICIDTAQDDFEPYQQVFYLE